jgi:hypothetical protein
MAEWQEIGKIVQLQIQTRSMKRLEEGRKIYQPEVALRTVEQFHVDCNGATAKIDGEQIIDKHNATHPVTHNNGSNPISVGFTRHYTEMQDRFGEHVALGIAGENIIIETDHHFTEEDMAGEVAFRGIDGQLIIMQDLFAMPPCEPFTRFCLQNEQSGASEVKAGLQFLNHGMRGFAGKPHNDQPLVIQVGDTVLLRKN